MRSGEAHERKVLHLISGGRDIFADWINGLKDFAGRDAILKRVDRIYEGNFGDHRAVGDGVFELRIHCGPGYRIYYGEDGSKIVLLLCGGDKGSQDRDIRKAQALWLEYKGTK